MVICSFICLIFVFSCGFSQNDISVEFLSSLVVRNTETFENTLIGGLSGIDYDADTDSYWIISDDRSERDAARAYNATIDLTGDSLNSIEFNSLTLIKTKKGNSFKSGKVDPEGIRMYEGNLYWTSEANDKIEPMIRQMNTEGDFLSEIEVPSHFLQSKGFGLRDNDGFEGLAVSQSEGFLYTAVQNTLRQDGDVAGYEEKGSSRLSKFDLATGEYLAEYLYIIDKAGVPEGANLRVGTRVDHGLTELIALGNEQFLALERSYIAGLGNSIKLYFVDASEATNIANVESIDNVEIQNVEKTLLTDIRIGLMNLGSGKMLLLDNMEGITFGPELEDGRQSLILVSDNNFNRNQRTLFMLFALDNSIKY